MRTAVLALCLFSFDVPALVDKETTQSSGASTLPDGDRVSPQVRSDYDPYGYNYSRYPRFPFNDSPPRRPASSMRERYVTVLVSIEQYSRSYDPNTGTWRQVVVSRRYVKRTIRCEWNAQQGCYGYFQDGRFIPVRD